MAPIRFVCAVFLGICAAAPQSTDAQKLLLKNYTTADGLPDSRIAPIFQDRDGYLWFGTQAGLTKYDGKEFINYSGPKEIPGIFRRGICQDHTGAIWFSYSGFRGGGIERIWNGKTATFLSAPDSTAVQCGTVIEDHDQSVWVATSEGVKRIRFTDSTRTRCVIDSFPQVSALAFLVDHLGRLWIGGDGLFTYSSGSFQDRLSCAGMSAVFHIRPYAIYESHSGEIWAGGPEGAACINDSGVTIYSVSDGLPDGGVWSFCEDRLGDFWVGTARGLYRGLGGARSARFTKDESFGNGIVYSMCLDAEGNLWFASPPGIRKLLATDFFIEFPGSTVLATAGIGPISQDESGMLYFGSKNSGMFIFDGRRMERQKSTTYTITSILPESREKVWLGIWRGGVDLSRGSAVRSIGVMDGLPSDDIGAIGRSPDGTLLVGTAAGLAGLDSSGSVKKIHQADLDTLMIFDIKTSAADGTVWLGTNHGVRVLTLRDDSIFSVITPAPLRSLAQTITYEILVDKLHAVWIGTDGSGLIRINGGSCTFFNKQDGLVGDRVYALAEDSLSNIWIGTSSGLSQFDGTSFRNFTANEGFNEIGIHGLTVDRQGCLWVSSYPGVSKILPREFVKSSQPPPIYITGIQADTFPCDPSDNFEIPYTVAAITFHYAGLSFTDEANVRYKYFLDGYDKSWSAPVSAREVRYTHLSPGNYSFKVFARNSIGAWSNQPATASFSVLPPLWEHWWFVVACAVAAGFAVYVAYRYRLDKILEIERTRSRIAMDLHDDIGSSLTRISVMTEVARRQRVTDPHAASDQMARIGETAREIIDSLGDIVWAVNPSYDDLQHAIRRIAEFGQETCEGRNITFETELERDFNDTRLSIEQRRDLYIIFKEGINNAVRHSNASCVRFTVHRTAEGALLMLEDNGRGFLPADETEGNGIPSMKARALRCGGSLNVMSVPGQGTKLILQLKTV